MPEPGQKKTVLQVLKSLRGLDDLKQLFWTELNYERENTPLSDRGWPDAAREALAEAPLLLAGGGTGGDFHVIYNRMKSEDLPRSLERQVVNQLLKEHPYALLVFSNERHTLWHFLNVKYDSDIKKRRLFRRITVRPGDGLRTAAERIAMLDLELIGPDLFGLSPLAIQARHDEAFDVEKVTKDFYKELANWYFWALRHVQFPKDAPKEADGHDHIGVIRMITRLIFCWFVKEKGLISGELFDQRRLDELLDGFAPEKDTRTESVFYKAILQNLFFATLNTEMDKRGWVKDEQNFMAHSLYRYRDLFQKPGEALALFKNIPFLNGGLFECLDKDLGESARPRYIRIDGFSRRLDSQPVVPDFLFFGSEREEDLSADYGDRKFKKVRVRGLIHTLNRYRFTIEENTPLEQEVALDPELSGKVFENLLAAYNPETGATARKQTGSFYTPREIVDYMVDEALIAFLKGGLPAEDEKATEEKLRRLASWEENGHDFDDRETELLIAAINDLKTLDPAVGSGAFPMGILHKLVFILGKLDPNNKQWEQRQIQRVRDAVAAAEKIEDAAVRERSVRELEQQIVGIEEAFERNELDYGRKLFLIENCLYGVDIQTIAVQIAKMRFFISLIVDQRMDPDAPNLGVRPLPNLETKFVAANTLIGIEKPKQGAFRSPDIDAKEAELRKVRERHFNAKTPGNKAKYRELDKKLRSEVAQLLKRDGWGDTTAKQLAAWDPYDQNASAPFFDPEWMFGVQKGFAVVIGNPPYIQIQSFSGRPEQKAWEQQNYVTYAKTGDVYGLFYEKGFGLLSAGGVLAYITSNKWMRANYGAKLREFFASQTAPQTLIDFGSYQVFDASTVDTNILVLVKQQSAGSGQPLHAVRIEKDFAADTDIPGYVKAKAVALKGLSSESWIISSLAEYDVRKRIEKAGVPLKEWDISINYGIKTGFNEAFIIDGRKKDELIARDPQSAEIIKPILRGQDIKRYKVEFADLWLINSHNGYGNVLRVDVKKDYRAVWEYLDSVNRYTQNKVANRQDQGVHWSNLRNCAYVAEFEKEKIVWGNLALSAQFALAKEGFFVNAPGTMITPASRYLLAVLNSSVGDYYIRSFGVSRSGGYFEYKPMFVENLPVPKLDLAARLPFEILVECVLFAREKGLDAEADLFESVIDGMAYDLYFGDDMRKAGCYITGRIAEAARPFKADDTDSFKTDYVRTLYQFCQKDQTVYHGLIHRRTVEAVRMITGEKI